MIKKIVLALICFLILTPQAYSQEGDKIGIEERLIRLEEGQKAINLRLEEGQKAMNQRLDDVNQRFGDIMGVMLCGFGVLLAGMFTLIGFVIWDRRTAVAPVAKKAQELEKEEEMIVNALLEYADVEPKMQNILTRIGFYKKRMPVSA